jgi:molybdopterin-containing oxidoreductase family iron-sulfur binding subunit
MNRRKFLEKGGKVLTGTVCAEGLLLLTSCNPSEKAEESRLSRHKWGMVIDLNKCKPECTACMEACRKENNVAFHGDKRWDIHWIRKVGIQERGAEDPREKMIPMLCNHCENPPCAQVCPVQATYKRADGIVIVDHHRCIGCRYCMIACPYNARFFNYKDNPDWPNKDYPRRSHGVAESCHFCAHLLDQGKQPACVEACERVGANAICFGDLKDPKSEISQLIESTPLRRIRADLGTEPKVYYKGL